MVEENTGRKYHLYDSQGGGGGRGEKKEKKTKLEKMGVIGQTGGTNGSPRGKEKSYKMNRILRTF